MSDSTDHGKKPRRQGRSIARILLLLVLGLVFLVTTAAAWAWWSVKRSLPPLEGEAQVTGLIAEAVVERDAQGIPTLRGSDRNDVALATGFVHGQDRFFQMDLLRRRAAGELSGLFGKRARNTDARSRVHRLREVARQALAAEPAARRELVEAYAAGVNAGLGSLAAPPFEYLFLRIEPAPWTPEDSYLVLLAMFLQMQGEKADYDQFLGLLQDTLSPALFDFLIPRGTEWDTANDGTMLAGGPLPSPEDVTLSGDAVPSVVEPAADDANEVSAADTGSNAWAVAGSRTIDGRALLANDMHLALTVPNIWYRASFAWTDEENTARLITGITLPGLPAMVSGSNGHVAWGFTNSQIDTSDLIVWEESEADDESYLTPDGREPYVRHKEVLRFMDGSAEELEVVWTRWGPLLEDDHRGRKRASRWVGHEPAAVNLHLLEMETVRDVNEAVEVANRSGMPAQNLLVADAGGRIAWTIAGQLPRRVGFEGRLPGSWATGERTWDGWLEPAEYPRLVDPESGLLWSANNRMVGGEMLAKLGDGSYMLAARARHIRDRLLAMEQPTEADMLELQLDDEAIFLSRWHDFLLSVLTPEAIQGDARLAEVRELVEGWEGRAVPEAIGYRVVRRFRISLARQVFGYLTQACKEVDEDFVYRTGFQLYEGPLWRLITERPQHLLNPEHADWDEQFLSAVDETIEYLTEDGVALAEQVWGRRNTLAIRHPLAGLPVIGSRLQMPAQQVPGDNYMPRVQHPSSGASQRLVVSPGREAEGFFQMPGGQSGHPFSEHFSDQQEAWVAGRAVSFLPGKAVRIYTLHPPP